MKRYSTLFPSPSLLSKSGGGFTMSPLCGKFSNSSGGLVAQLTTKPYSRVRFPPPPFTLFDLDCRFSSEEDQHSPAPALRSTTARGLSGYGRRRIFRRILNRIVSYDNRTAAKGRFWFDRKERPHNRKCLRNKCEGNEGKHCCTFHVRRFYHNQPR